MTNTETTSIESIYDGIFDLTTPLDDLLREKQNLQQRINVINKEIQNNLILNLDVMKDYGFTVVEIGDTNSIYSKGKYRMLINYSDPYTLYVYRGMDQNPFTFLIESQSDFDTLLKLLCIE